MAKKEIKEVKKIGRTMPYDIDAEIATLGSILLDENVANEIIPKLKEEEFYSNTHKIIFSAMDDLQRIGTPVDIVTLADRLTVKGQLEEVGSLSYLSQLTESVISASNGYHYMEMVKRDALTRKVITTCNNILEYSYECEEGKQALEEAEKQIFKISDEDRTSELAQIGPAMREALTSVTETQLGRTNPKVVYTGFPILDSTLTGLKPGEMILIAARPSVGKTAFALNIAANVAVNYKKNVAIFSLEMDAPLLAKRMMAYTSGVSLSKMAKRGALTEDDNKKLFKAHQILSNSGIYVDDFSMNTPQDILSKSRKLVRQKGCDLILIDYLQLMSTKKKGGKDPESRQNEVAEMSRAMKVYAKDLGVPIVVLSQLSRGIEARKEHEPQLSDLRESGAIEQDADVVMFLSKPYNYNSAEPEDKVELYIKKNRNGALEDIELKWDGPTTSFKEVGKLKHDGDISVSVPGTEPTNFTDEDLDDIKKIVSYSEDFSEVADDFSFDSDEVESTEYHNGGDLEF